MRSKETENETAAIVRALITARGQDGATLDDIKGMFYIQRVSLKIDSSS